MTEAWLCAGCAAPADKHFLTGCDCPTGIVFQRKSGEHRLKGQSCHRHVHRPSRINLDGENLCQECADQWVLGERDAAEDRIAALKDKPNG